MNRRSFLALLVVSIPSLRAIAQEGAAPAAPAAAGPAPKPDAPVAKESDPMPKALNYCESADKGKAKVCPTRKEKGREKQYCSNCQFYTAAGKKGKDDVGNCTILQGNLVKAKGWCNTYAPKAT
ncbi:MAG: high-potential iron-sulfur protein [Bdellovibrionia bacterium]